MDAKKQPPMMPIEMQQATEEIIRELGRNINAAINHYFPGSGFTLIVFPLNEPSIFNFISNAERSSVIEALKETLSRLKQNEEKAGTPKVVQ
jgi:predicted AlkP superfamily phosphohydrolase/phosphomutase